MLAASALRITELMYNPAPATAAEVGFSTQDFDFLEIQNTGADAVPMASVALTLGVTFTFPTNIPGTSTPLVLQPGQYVVVAADQLAFAMRHPTFSGIIAGEFSGNLKETGETVRLNDALGAVIQEFTYANTWLPITDGQGFSLTVRDPAQASALWSSSDGWQASAVPGGSPGYNDGLPAPGTIIINEVLAHSDTPYGDAVELYNTTAAPVNVGGWLLSDNSSNLVKYQLASGTVIPAGGYLVLTQVANFGIGASDPGLRDGFGFSEYGFDAYLSSSAVVNSATIAGGYREHAGFGGTPSGFSVGEHTKSTGGTDVTLLATPTFGEAQGGVLPGAPNSVPYQPALVLNEVMYHPTAPSPTETASGYVTSDFEYVEIYNRSGAAIALPTNPYADLNQSRYDLSGGVGFSFGWLPADTAGGSVTAAWTREAGATATWNATNVGSSQYEVLASFRLNDPRGNLRKLDSTAVYTINHAGGTATVTIDQNSAAGRQLDPDSTLWVSLGYYTFNGAGSVTLTRGAAAAPSEETIAGNIVLRQAAAADKTFGTPTVTSPFTQSGIASIAPDSCLVVVSNAAAFQERYNNADHHIAVAGVYTGRLKDSGDDVALNEHMSPDADSITGYIPRYRLEYVSYKSSGSWPAAADGQGPALQRIQPGAYANDAANWLASAGQLTPGVPNVMLLSFDTPDAQHVRLFFSEPLTAANAETVGNYVMSGASVTSATLAAGGQMVTLALSNPMFPSVQYPLAVNNMATASGHPAPATIQLSVSYPTNDVSAPTATVTPVSPNPRSAPVSSINIVFSEAILGFNLADLTLRREGGANLLTGSQTLTSSDNITWTLGNLSGLTAPAGDYVLTLTAAGSGIVDASSNPLSGDAATTWLVDLVAPTATITPVSPNPRATAVGSLAVVFSKPVSGFNLADLALRRDGGANLLTGAQTLTTIDNLTWTLGNTSTLTTAAGNYSLTLTAAGSGITDAAGNALAGDAATAWLTDPVSPIATITAVTPNPRATPVTSLTVVFTKAVSGFNLADLALRRDGGANLLTASQVLSTSDAITWTLGNLGSLTAAAGNYTLTLTAAGSGIVDGVGNGLAGDASTSWQADPLVPTATLTGAPPTINAAGASTATTLLTVTYADQGSGIDPASLGAANLAVDHGATVSGFSATGNVVEYTLSAPAGTWGASFQGTYTVSLVANQVRDRAGNYVAAKATLATFAVDTVAPTVTVEQAAGQVDPTGSRPIHFTVTFSEVVNGFDASDVLLGGTAGDALTATVSGSGASYDVAVNGITRSGTVTAQVTAGAAQDGAGNASAASTSQDNVVTYRQNGPTACGVYDPGESKFYLKYTNNEGFADLTFGFGIPGWKPLAGDWNGDGVDTIGLFQPAAAHFYLRNSNDSGPADASFGYGNPSEGDQYILVMGDWNGDGIDTIGLYHKASATWFLRNSNSEGMADVTVGFGVPGSTWTPVVGDWDGDGHTTIGLYDPSTGMFYLRNSLSTGMADIAFPYGAIGSGWQPLIGDWDGDGRESGGFYQPGVASHFHLRNAFTPGPADVHFGLGFAGVQPVVGSWLGPVGAAPAASGVAHAPLAASASGLPSAEIRGAALTSETTVAAAQFLEPDLPVSTAKTPLSFVALLDPRAVDEVDLATVVETELHPPLAEKDLDSGNLFGSI